MRRAFFLILAVFGMAIATFGQAASSDSQTLQALLSEVRALRQDLQNSLTRVQSAQILLSRLQIQEAVVTRASQHLEKSERAEIRHYEDKLSTEADSGQRQNLQDNINSAQSDLEASTLVEQQRQAAETEARQQLQTEQAKLNTLETQLDELVRNMDNHIEQSPVPR
jgi:chromosome segregation ATPase